MPNTAYEKLLERCRELSWDVSLAWGKRGWRLEIREDDDLICKVRSAEKVPECFDQLASRAVVSLTRAKLFGG